MDLILNILKQDHIYDIYIGVTGIIVFIAEVVKDQNNELNKKSNPIQNKY